MTPDSSSPISCRFILLLLLLTTVVLLPTLFCGFELCDTGYYLVFYRDIFTHPKGVSYNFMYWLSGVLGGGVASLFPGEILPLRIMGLICTLLTVWCAASILRPCHSRGAIIAGTLLVALGAWSAPSTFHNDTLSYLMCAGSILLLFSAMRHSGWRAALLMLLGGAIAGTSIFARVPNLLLISIVALIPLYSPAGFTRSRVQLILLFTAGYLLGISLMILLMNILGHTEYYLDCLKLLFGGSGEGGDATHGIGRLISVQIEAWLRIGRVALEAGILLFLARSTSTMNISGRVKRLIYILLLLPAAAIAWLTDYVTLLASISFTLSAGNLILSKDPDVRFASWSGLLMMTVLPLGCDGAIYNMGTPVLWLALPASLLFLYRDTITANIRIAFSPVWRSAIIAILFIAGIRYTFQGFYGDNSTIFQSNAEVAHSGIYTNQTRAATINALTAEIRRQVPEGATLTVYGSAPMLNYLTDTRPALGNSWPELYPASQIERSWEERVCSERGENVQNVTPKEVRDGNLPEYVLMLKFSTLGSEFGLASEAFMQGYSGVNSWHTQPKSQLMLRELQKHGYTLNATTPLYNLYSYSKYAPK